MKRGPSHGVQFIIGVLLATQVVLGREDPEICNSLSDNDINWLRLSGTKELKNMSDGHSHDNEDGNRNNSNFHDDPCRRLLLKIENLANKIVRPLTLLRELDRMDSKMHMELQTEYNKASMEFDKLVGPISRTNLSSELFKAKLAEFRVDLANTEVEIQEGIEKLTISLLQEGEHWSAVDEFKKLASNGPPSQLSKIIREAYTTGNNSGRMVERIIEFVRILPSCGQDMIAYPTLVDSMKEHEQLTSPHILMLRDALKTCSNSLRRLSKTVEIRIGELLASWTSLIRKGEYGPILEYAGESAMARRSIDTHPTIVGMGYGGPGDFERVLNFISQLPPGPHLGSGYLRLFLAMQEKEENIPYGPALQLAYKVKRGMATASSEDWEKFEALKNLLPDSVKKIIWGGVCTIRNRYHNELLFTANFKLESEPGIRQVFTWISDPGKWVGGSSTKWLFEPADESGKTFYIKNARFRDARYLCQRKGAIFGPKRNNVQTVSRVLGEPAECKWELEQWHSDGQWWFGLKTKSSRGGGEMRDVYLYAAVDYFNYDKESRRVFTWLTGGFVWQGYWDLDCE